MVTQKALNVIIAVARFQSPFKPPPSCLLFNLSFMRFLSIWNSEGLRWTKSMPNI